MAESRLDTGLGGESHMNKFRVAVVGPGSNGKTYADALKNSETVVLAAVSGHDTKKGRQMADSLQVPYYTDQDEMYEKESPDAVIICTPTYTHEEIVKRAFSHRVPVMCEKPFTLHSETAEQLIAQADSLGLRLMVMHVVRFWPEYAALAQMIRENAFGPVKNIYLNRLSTHPAWAEWHRDPEKSGGGLFDLHIHDIDYLYSIFGNVESVYAVGAQEASGCWNNVSTALRFTCGVSAVVEGFMDITGSYPFTTVARINGSKAAAEYSNQTGCINLYERNSPARPLDIPKYNPYAREVEYFAGCVRNREETTLMPGEDVVSVLKILEAVRWSLETGQIVKP